MNSVLFKPATIKGIQLKNRFVRSATAEGMATFDGFPTGGHRTPELMARILAAGAADFISMSRPFIREPGLIKRWKDGDLAKAKCISCNQCFENWVSHPLRCYVEEPLKEKHN